MIKAKDGKVQGKGTDAELLTDLSTIIQALIDEEVQEEAIDIAVGLGKAKAKGKKEYEAYKDKIIEELEKRKNANIQTMAINLSELIKQVKKEKEENEG